MAVGACGRRRRTRRSLGAVRELWALYGPDAAVSPALAAGSAVEQAWNRTRVWLVCEMSTVTAEAKRPFGVKPDLSGLT